jgi:hypothetical protein
MSHVQGCHPERIDNHEGRDRYLVGLMVCAVGDEGLGIVGFDESGGSVFYLRIGILVVWVLKFGIVCLKDVGCCYE